MQNFLIKLAVIYLSLYCNKFQVHISSFKGIGKIALASFMGTFIEVMGLMFSDSYQLFLILIHILELPFMFWIIDTKMRRKRVQLIITGYLFIMIVNGVLEVLWNWFGESGGYIFYLICSCGFVIVAVRIWMNYKREEKGVFQVEFIHRGKHIKTYGFYDSGNCLIDPYSNKGVHIASGKLLEQLDIKKETAVLVPYHALGTEEGLLKVYYIEEMLIEREKQKSSWKDCPLGVTKENLFEERKYEIILNQEVF